MYMYVYKYRIFFNTKVVLGKFLFSLHNGVAELRVKDKAQPPFLKSRGGKKERVVYWISSSQPRNASRAGNASMHLPGGIS